MTLSSFRANGRRKSTHSAEASIDLLEIANTDRPHIFVRNRSCGPATVRTRRRMLYFEPGLGLILDSYTIFLQSTIVQLLYYFASSPLLPLIFSLSLLHI